MDILLPLKEKDIVTFYIDSECDRRTLAAILADNGYFVKIEKISDSFTFKSFYKVIVNLNRSD